MTAVFASNSTVVAAGSVNPGPHMHALVRELYPICRSITGNGLRETLRKIGEGIPLQIHEVPSGTQVFDWSVPKEWNIQDAYIKNSLGQKVVDFRKSNLHVMNYSVPVNSKMSLRELKPHLHTLPQHPEWIPYRTSYYHENWGFCLSQQELDGLPEGEYEVLIDSTLENGSMTDAEGVLEGPTHDEILISIHCCHPSLCNDNLSGTAVGASAAHAVARLPRRHTYRFLFIPGTIGSTSWICRNEDSLSRIKHGLVLACLGDRAAFSYKKSRRGNAEIDRVVTQLLTEKDDGASVREFSPYGYDERQYCSPAFNLPVGCLNRSPHGEFPEYHSSADNLEFVREEALAEAFRFCLEVFEFLESNRTYRNLNPKCEPQLGKRGLYREVGGHGDAQTRELARLWMLNLSDGKHSLLDIVERSKMPFNAIRSAAADLQRHGLLESV